MTPFLAFVVLLVLSVVAAAAPLFLPRRRGVRTGLLVPALLGILAKAVLCFWRAPERFLAASDLFVYFERDVAVPFGVFFFAVAAGVIDDPRNRRAVKVMPFLLIAYLVVSNAWTLRRPACYDRSDGIWHRGVCIQSSDFTCGAASIATVFSMLGVPGATEHEAAELSLTIPGRGVTDLGAALALRKKLPGRKVEIRFLPLDELSKVKPPALLPLRYNFWFDHMTVFMGMDGDNFVVGDPLRGPVRMSRAELEGRYLGDVITVD